jgi:hypothetical protein
MRRFRKFSETHPYRIAEDFNLRPGEDIGDYTFTIKVDHVPSEICPLRTRQSRG